MRDHYFHMYCSIKYKECFYNAHYDHAQNCYNTYTFLMLLISITSVAAWSISKDLPALWAIIIAAAQFAQACSVRLTWAKQLAALQYLKPELAKLSLDLDKSWRDIDLFEYNDSKISTLISKYEQQYSNLESQFTNGIKFGCSRSIMKRAEKNQRAYFYIRYPETRIEQET
jgi:hypothetical protein